MPSKAIFVLRTVHSLAECLVRLFCAENCVHGLAECLVRLFCAENCVHGLVECLVRLFCVENFVSVVKLKLSMAERNEIIKYSRLSLSRLRLSRITAYLEEKI